RMTVDELIASPFRAKTGCCGATLYEREEDMPQDYPVRPNHTEIVPHLDGTECSYRFFVPPGAEASDFGFDSNRAKWFCSAAEVWWARAFLLHTLSPQSVLRGLATRAFLADDERAYRALAAIYARLAEVYPGWPLTDFSAVANGLARSGDMKGYLTQAEYRATPVPRAYDKPKWFHARYYNLDKMNMASGWQDGVMGQQANLVDIFDLIRDHPSVLAYSRERYGDEREWERRVRKGVVDEAHFIGQWSPTMLWGGNTMIGWVKGGLKLGTVARDEYFIRTAAVMIQGILQNHFWGDGLSVEGAFNYGGMMQGAVDIIPALRDEFGVDFSRTFPYAARIAALGSSPVRTLWGVESMHNDEHASFFLGSGWNWSWKTPPNKEPAYSNEAAQCFPEYGLVALRAGAPGRRMEAIFNFQGSVNHCHTAQLNLQLFYEGVQTMPDIGYSCSSADITKAPWPQIQYPFAKLPFPSDALDFWWAWYHMGNMTETHNVALVDSYHTEYPRYGPATFRRFLGVERLEEPGALAQFAETDADGIFSLRPETSRVDIFNRQIAAVTLPSGEPLLLDFHRVRGGKRHDLIWHAPSTGPDAVLKTSLGPSTPIPNMTMYDYFQREIPGAKQIPKGEGLHNFRRLGRWDMPDRPWKFAFEIRPKLFEPATPGGKALYAPWSRALQDVDLDLWGSVAGGPTTKRELVEARAPWPSKMLEVIDGQEVPGGRTIALQDALHYVFESRVAPSNGLYSAYAHVLEPRLTNQPPIVRGIRQLAPGPGDDPTGAGLRIDCRRAGATSNVVLYAGATLGGGRLAADGLRLDGRFGLAMPVETSLCVFDGTRVSAEGLSGSVKPSWRLKLLGVVGDLTGTPDQSALLVSSDRPLPTDRTLAGRVLTVQHQISPRHTTGYTIERVSPWGRRGWWPWGGKRYRIDLANTPPFILHRMAVKSIDAKNARVMTSDYSFMKGQNPKGLYDGRRVRFPRIGFDSPMALQGGGWFAYNFEVLDPLPAEQPIKVGEPFIVYQIQPGDEVIIPSHLAVRGTAVADGVQLDIQATGPCEVTVPGRWTRVVDAEGARTGASPRVKFGANATSIALDGAGLPDGQRALVLN
ncbi:MAG: hypothetical protein PHR35_19250, partial [Kiritimatiellae bacterium]|nr:hypothetical protein [Kiritimatiellia bacterium]